MSPSLRTLVIASGNLGKIREFEQLLTGLPLQISAQPDGLDVEETGQTFAANARLKAVAVADATVSLLPLDGVIYVKCMAIAAGSVKFGMSMYVSQTSDSDGHVDNDSSNSAVLVGYFVGKGGVAISTGDLVPVAVA